jgi:hypothetical protein
MDFARTNTATKATTAKAAVPRAVTLAPIPVIAVVAASTILFCIYPSC